MSRYNDEEWSNLIAADPDWTREETDYLLDLCEQFALKFFVIADRYEVGLLLGGGCLQVHTPRACICCICTVVVLQCIIVRDVVCCIHHLLLAITLHDHQQPTQYKGKERSVDEIKARYYAIARQLLIGREGGAQHVANHALVKHPFNLQYEVNRKKGMDLIMANKDITIVRGCKGVWCVICRLFICRLIT